LASKKRAQKLFLSYDEKFYEDLLVEGELRKQLIRQIQQARKKAGTKRE
jgi:hypothetical protein